MIILDFFTWHYLKASDFIIRVWFNFVDFGFYFFSVKLLLKTLFSPWRRVELVDKTPGFSLQKLFQQLTFNLISRFIGVIVRSIFIFCGLIFTLLIFLLGLIIFIAWQFLIPFSLPLFLLLKPRPKTEEEILQSEGKDFILKRLGVKTKEELAKLPPEDVKETLAWYLKVKETQRRQSYFWEKENLYKIPAFGTQLAFGFTTNLDQYCQDLSSSPTFAHQLIGREKEIKQMESALSRSSQSNLLLIGEPGVGKHTILYGFVKAVLERQVNPSLFYKRVMLLNMDLVLGKAGIIIAAKELFLILLKEAEAAGNIILVIDQIEKYISQQEGIDLTSALTPMIESNRIQVIGITTPTNFERYIFSNEQIIKYFEKVEVSPPSKAEALDILEKIIPSFEKGKKVIVTFPALKEIINQSDRLITNIPFPEKAIDLVDQLVNEAKNSGRSLIDKTTVDELISQKVKIPVGNLSQDEKTKLKNLNLIIHRRLIDQRQAVEALVSAMQRVRLGIAETEKPLGAFLFLGPTGVGKTETAKALAEAFFGSEKQMLRFDMAQPFQFNLFIQEARECPYGVLLLDEFEKASKEVLNLFLTVFDEGYLKDANGELVSFKNMIIICTSNAGAEFIRQQLKKNPPSPLEQFQTEVTEYVLQQRIFSPEIINRFDSVIIYKPLEAKEIEEISRLMIVKLNNRLAKQEINLSVDPSVYLELATQGHSFEFGARPMKRLIADKIESQIAKLMLDEQIKANDKLKLTVDQESKEFRIEKAT